MSYNFKKINELELINEVPEGANVLIETDGATKRLPSTAIKSDDSYSKEESDTRYLTKDSIATPDLAQNDPAAPDYVKGRTHWVEEDAELFPEQELVIPDGSPITVSDVGFTFLEGANYKIFWNGVEYNCVAGLVDGILSVGNGGIFGMDDTGEPFVIGIQDNNLIVIQLNHDTSATVKILGRRPHKIDDEYLPDNLCYVTTFYPIEDFNSVTWLFKDPNMQEKASREELMAAARNGVIILNCAGWQYIYGAAVVDVDLGGYGFARYWGPYGIDGDMVQYCAYTAEYEPPTES